MTLIKFNSGGINTIFENKLIGDVPEITEADYHPQLVTPLYDAVAFAIRKADSLLAVTDKVMTAMSGSPAEKPLVLISIMTDGQENASQETHLTDLNRLIMEKQRNGWNFTFLGCDLDSWKQAVNMGIPQGNAAIYSRSAPDQAMTRYAAGTSCLRSTYMAHAGGQSVTTSDFFGPTTTNTADASNPIPDEIQKIIKEKKGKKGYQS